MHRIHVTAIPLLPNPQSIRVIIVPEPGKHPILQSICIRAARNPSIRIRIGDPIKRPVRLVHLVARPRVSDGVVLDIKRKVDLAPRRVTEDGKVDVLDRPLHGPELARGGAAGSVPVLGRVVGRLVVAERHGRDQRRGHAKVGQGLAGDFARPAVFHLGAVELGEGEGARGLEVDTLVSC